MRTIKLLDCTLRDGGYINNNKFGYNDINLIKDALVKSNIDIIECGYIKDIKKEYSKDYTEYNSFEDLRNKQKIKNKTCSYTLMLLGQEYNIENLPNAIDKDSIIRMSFHKNNLDKAIQYGYEIKKRGYKLYLQPTVTMDYTEKELEKMFEKINLLNPVAVSIVDTFGQMKPEDVSRLSNIFDKRINKTIIIGFHAHNNLQNAFANAVAFISNTNRDIIIDCSICGMGRGAGNLPTELMIDYLNHNNNANYNIEPILEVSDNVVEKIKAKNNWGYSLPYYLSAIYGIHPNYVINFMKRKTLNTTDINRLLRLIKKDKKIEYDGEYAKSIYNSFIENNIDDSKALKRLSKIMKNKEILLIGPGKSIINKKNEIDKYINKENTISISVNNITGFDTNYIFFSNRSRYESYSEKLKAEKLIITSNIISEKDALVFDYSKYISADSDIYDNSIIMLLNILKNMDIKKIVLAGFDGFNTSNNDNYYSTNIENILSQEYINSINNNIKDYLSKYMRKTKIDSLTKSKYID